MPSIVLLKATAPPPVEMVPVVALIVTGTAKVSGVPFVVMLPAITTLLAELNAIELAKILPNVTTPVVVIVKMLNSPNAVPTPATVKGPDPVCSVRFCAEPVWNKIPPLNRIPPVPEPVKVVAIPDTTFMSPDDVNDWLFAINVELEKLMAPLLTTFTSDGGVPPPTIPSKVTTPVPAVIERELFPLIVVVDPEKSTAPFDVTKAVAPIKDMGPVNICPAEPFVFNVVRRLMAPAVTVRDVSGCKPPTTSLNVIAFVPAFTVKLRVFVAKSASIVLEMIMAELEVVQVEEPVKTMAPEKLIPVPDERVVVILLPRLIFGEL